MSDSGDVKPESLAKRKRRGKTARLLKVAEYQLAVLRPYFDDYVRVYRAVFDISPDTDDVSDTLPMHLYETDDEDEGG